jgi:hypothetical protein
MISPEEACRYVQTQLPDITYNANAGSDIYDTLQSVREYACEKAREHNYSLLLGCFELADSLYERGGNAVRCAVENVFVYSFSRMISMAPEDRLKIKSLMPVSLQSLYMNQVMHRGY